VSYILGYYHPQLQDPSRAFQRKLFTPDIFNVSDRVKAALMGTDPGIRHTDYIYAVE